MIQTIFAMDEEEMNPSVPEEEGEGMGGGGEMPASEPESRFDDEDDSGDGMETESRLDDGDEEDGSNGEDE